MNIVHDQIFHDEIKQKISCNESFFVSRAGLAELHYVWSRYCKKNFRDYILKLKRIIKSPNEVFSQNRYWDLYAPHYYESYINANYQALWKNKTKIQSDLDKTYSKIQTYFNPDVLHPFEYSKPWTHGLKHKKVLIVSPFKDDFENQLDKWDKIWPGNDFMPKCTFMFHKTEFITEDTYLNVYPSEVEKISKYSFDIALVSYGMYGLPICNYIYQVMDKSAIYVGGALQLYFGIKGTRWDSFPNITSLYNQYWAYPQGEKPKNYGYMTDSYCYW